MATSRKGKADHDRAAAGQDYDNPIRDKAASLGAAMADGGPQALFDEIENLLPEEWREHIRSFPLTAVVLGVGIGVYLGMRKGDELIAAGSSMVSAAAMANMSRFMDRTNAED
ncbi:MAG TPA: hypothetical protein VFT12_02395 [Thermoanaerobaculia bacterium]|nr:hypothetical protein [Thermoanaerobaculia bacterium]